MWQAKGARKATNKVRKTTKKEKKEVAIEKKQVDGDLYEAQWELLTLHD